MCYILITCNMYNSMYCQMCGVESRDGQKTDLDLKWLSTLIYLNQLTLTLFIPSVSASASGSHLSVALKVRMGQFGAGELQQSQCDGSSFHFGTNGPNRTVTPTLRCVRRPVGPDRPSHIRPEINIWKVKRSLIEPYLFSTRLFLVKLCLYS